MKKLWKWPHKSRTKPNLKTHPTLTNRSATIIPKSPKISSTWKTFKSFTTWNFPEPSYKKYSPLHSGSKVSVNFTKKPIKWESKKKTLMSTKASSKKSVKLLSWCPISGKSSSMMIPLEKIFPPLLPLLSSIDLLIKISSWGILEMKKLESWKKSKKK